MGLEHFYLLKFHDVYYDAYNNAFGVKFFYLFCLDQSVGSQS